MKKKLGSITSSTVDEPIVNLTPLIDVVFVILIVFILAAPLLELDRVELAKGSSKLTEHSSPSQNNSPIAIHVREDNTILFNSQQVNLNALSLLFKQAKGQYPEAHPQIFHDHRASFGTYQAIKNAAEEAGFREMDVILKPS